MTPHRAKAEALYKEIHHPGEYYDHEVDMLERALASTAAEARREMVALKDKCESGSHDNDSCWFSNLPESWWCEPCRALLGTGGKTAK